MSKILKLIFIFLCTSTMTSSCGNFRLKSNKKSDNDPALNPTSGADSKAAPASTSIESAAEQLSQNMPNSRNDDAIKNRIQLKPLSSSGVPERFSSWDQFNSPNDPETFSLQIFDGKDAAKELFGVDPRCTIYIMAAYLNAEARPTFVVRTSFSHNNDTHPYILLTLKDETALTALGNADENKYQIFFKLNTAGDIYSAQTVNLKWFHINHYDTGVCESLKPRRK